MEIEIELDPLQVRVGARSFGGPCPALDLRMLELVAVSQPLTGLQLERLLWPSMPQAWSRERLAQLRRALRKRLGAEALVLGPEGWNLSRSCKLATRRQEEQASAEGLSGSSLQLLEAISRQPQGLLAGQLAQALGVSPAALRQRISRARRQMPEGTIIGGGGGYRVSAKMRSK